MNETHLKNEFDEYIRCFIKFTDTWYYPLDILDCDTTTRIFFKKRFDKLVEILNEDDTKYLDMETDDIFDMLMKMED